VRLIHTLSAFALSITIGFSTTASAQTATATGGPAKKTVYTTVRVESGFTANDMVGNTLYGSVERPNANPYLPLETMPHPAIAKIGSDLKVHIVFVGEMQGQFTSGNSNGEAVGSAYPPNFGYEGQYHTYPIIYKGGVINRLNSYYEDQLRPLKIAANGEIVGITDEVGGSRTFRLSPGETMPTFLKINGEFPPAAPITINTSNNICVMVPTMVGQQTMIWHADGQVSDVGTAYPNDMNDAGEIIGTQLIPLPLPRKKQRGWGTHFPSVYYEKGILFHTASDFEETVRPGAQCHPLSINNQGDIVGVDQNGTFLLKKSGELVRIGRIAKLPRGSQLMGAYKINNEGVILVMYLTGRRAAAVLHQALLVP
jgi:hypothetical protein